MKDGSMFASLTQYKDKEYYQGHPLIVFATLEKTYQWEIFSVVITDTSYDYLQTNFKSIEQRSGFISILQEKSLYETAALPSGTDDILILSTCTYEYEDARFVIAARRMD
jgi:sortase B